MGTQETRAVIEEFYRALQKPDRDRVIELLAADCRWDPPATAPIEPLVGAEPIAKALTGGVIKETFDISKPFSLEVRSMTVEDDRAVVQQRLQATAKATGQPYDNQYCWVYTVRDGKITAMEEYADTLLASRAMAWS